MRSNCTKLFWNDLMRNDQNSKFKQISNFKNFLLKHLMCVLWTSSVTVISTLYRKSLSRVWGNISSTKFSESSEQHFNIVRMSLSSKSVFCHLVCIIASRSIYKATTKLHIYLSMTFQQCQNIDFFTCVKLYETLQIHLFREDMLRQCKRVW